MLTLARCRIFYQRFARVYRTTDFGRSWIAFVIVQVLWKCPKRRSERLGREWIGVEIEEEYVKGSALRFEKPPQSIERPARLRIVRDTTKLLEPVLRGKPAMDDLFVLFRFACAYGTNLEVHGQHIVGGFQSSHAVSCSKC